MDWTPTEKDLSGRLGGEQQALFFGPSWEAMQVARTWTGRMACCLSDVHFRHACTFLNSSRIAFSSHILGLL